MGTPGQRNMAAVEHGKSSRIPGLAAQEEAEFPFIRAALIDAEINDRNFMLLALVQSSGVEPEARCKIDLSAAVLYVPLFVRPP